MRVLCFSESSSLSAESMVLLLNDWAHVSRKFTQGEYAKCLHNRKENDSKIKVRAPSERCAAHPVAAQLAPSQESMHNMRKAPSNTAFSALRGAAAALWRGIGESDFLGSFSKMYLEGEWASWHVGAAPAGVLSSLPTSPRRRSPGGARGAPSLPSLAPSPEQKLSSFTMTR